MDGREPESLGVSKDRRRRRQIFGPAKYKSVEISLSLSHNTTHTDNTYKEKSEEHSNSFGFGNGFPISDKGRRTEFRQPCGADHLCDSPRFKFFVCGIEK